MGKNHTGWQCIVCHIFYQLLKGGFNFTAAKGLIQEDGANLFGGVRYCADHVPDEIMDDIKWLKPATMEIQLKDSGLVKKCGHKLAAIETRYLSKLIEVGTLYLRQAGAILGENGTQFFVPAGDAEVLAKTIQMHNPAK